MFKAYWCCCLFRAIDDFGVRSQIKSSAIKALRKEVDETYPSLGGHLEAIWPTKKETVVTQAKLKLYFPLTPSASGVINLYFVNDELLFIQPKDKKMMPVLRLLHRYPYMMAHVQCDKGGTKSMLSGSKVMCQGLTSAGGVIDPSIEEGQPVAIMLEGKKNAVGLGIAMMAADKMFFLPITVGKWRRRGRW
eukprot:TRINITY_DN1820_c0_g1_i2.p2 TRINITY_DN1820_c0_g1~~TRINITY_DN1820_c0_g1_i2.p2  ORF type:complete len:191 (+),score=52.81 TRINITY_DN1820_c0_g1_i2:163-735(+)